VDQPPTSRKGPAFREKNIPVKSSKFDHPLERKERKEGKSSNPYHLDRPEKQFANDRAPCKDKTGRGVSVKRKA
jgi:endo-1,4-beta-xylanase